MMKTIKDKIRKRLISEYGSLFSREITNKNEIKDTVHEVLAYIVEHENLTISEAEKKKIVADISDELTGYGPIEDLMNDPSVTEIMINGPDKVYVERHGKKALANITFDNEQQLMALIYKMLAPTRRRVDESYPYTDVSLKDGSRVNIIIPPLALDGPTITIRKFLKEIGNIDDLIKLGTLDKRMGDFLIACIHGKINMIFSGATGSGKTTTLNALSYYLPADERVVTIEDTAELTLTQEHVVRLETRLPNIEGKGEISIRDLFKNALRMRPGRIILGEIRSAEALDMLQAMCSGHRGSLAVIHATSPNDVIYRLETMALTSGLPMTLEAIHRQIAAAINIIIQQQQLVDGSRKITYITQINGIKNGQAILEDIFIYEVEGLDADGRVKGKWKATGVVPSFYPLFEKAGIKLSKDIFNKD